MPQNNRYLCLMHSICGWVLTHTVKPDISISWASVLQHISCNVWKKNILQCANTYQRRKTEWKLSAQPTACENSTKQSLKCWWFDRCDLASGPAKGVLARADENRVSKIVHEKVIPIIRWGGKLGQQSDSRLHTPLSSLIHCGHSPGSQPQSQDEES